MPSKHDNLSLSSGKQKGGWEGRTPYKAVLGFAHAYHCKRTLYIHKYNCNMFKVQVINICALITC